MNKQLIKQDVKIIFVDGPDFSGKTTFIKNLIEKIDPKFKVITLRFPTDEFRKTGFDKPASEYQEDIFDELRNTLDQELTGDFGVERNPLLILCDRGMFTSLVYQYDEQENIYNYSRGYGYINALHVFDPWANISVTHLFLIQRPDILVSRFKANTNKEDLVDNLNLEDYIDVMATHCIRYETMSAMLEFFGNKVLYAMADPSGLYTELVLKEENILKG